MSALPVRSRIRWLRGILFNGRVHPSPREGDVPLFMFGLPDSIMAGRQLSLTQEKTGGHRPPLQNS